MRKPIVAFVALLLVVAGLAACSGDDDNNSSSGSETTEESGSATTDRTVAPGDLSDLLARQNDAVIKVTYQRGNETFTIAQDHEKKAITSGSTMVITDDDTTVNCTDLDTEPSCLEVPEGIDSLVNVGLSFYNVVAQGLADAADRVPNLETKQETVAGRDATCATGDSNSFLAGLADTLGGDLELPSLEARVCVDNATGYLLEFSTNGDQTDNLVATEVTKPTKADFEPPAPVDPIPPDPNAIPPDSTGGN
jgi:hypothetical protein